MRIFVRSVMLAAAMVLTVGSTLVAQDENGAAEIETRTTAQGVFSEAQATRGEDVFWNICSECHFEDDFGGAFVQSWNGASVKDLLDEIVSTMPEDNPGGLPKAQYIDVITYMFKLNGLPTGEADLTEEELDAVEIEFEP